jgi:hydroxymethylbilane synthase
VSALRIGTRGSALALWQAQRVASLIGAQSGSPPIELVHIKTEGDVRTDVPLWAVGGRAFFTKEIDRALLAKDIDVAVHSLKDLATALEPGIELAAVLEREDPRDALISRQGESRLADLPHGARVGTSSLRRRAFLARARSDLVTADLRGNVPTRIEKLQRGEYDAIVLATAGLKRLALDSHISAFLPTSEFPSAVSQGAIGVCARSDDKHALRWLHGLDHLHSRIATTAERALLKRIEGGCQVPLGALATMEGDELRLFAAVCALDGSMMFSTEERLLNPDRVGAALLGVRVAEQLLTQGAGRVIEQQRGAPQAAEAP